MADLVFLCENCGVKLLGFANRAGQEIVCPRCRKKTHVPEKQEELLAPSNTPDSAHHHGTHVHHRVYSGHVVKQVMPATRTLVLSGLAAFALFALVGYWSFNPNSLNPGKTAPVVHHVAAAISADAKPPVEGQNWTSPVTGMEFVWISALNMWVGKYEVTNEEYLEKETAHDSRSFENNSMNGARQPVTYVSFDNARDYAVWLTTAEKSVLGARHYRLPSEKEWIASAQCGNNWSYPWGNNWPPVSGQAGNYHGQEGAGVWEKLAGYNDQHPVTCNVEESWANPWNLFGVGGNVWEACAADDDAATFGAWLGGSWNNCIPERLHSSNRIDVVGEPSLNMGFRLVMSR